MNTDVGDIFRKLKTADPLKTGAVASLIITIILTIILVPGLFRTIQERNDLQAEYQAASDAVNQIQLLQAAQPDALQGLIDAERAKLDALLINYPTAAQASAELSRYYEYASELGAQLVRMEAMILSPEEEAQTSYRVQRFLLDVRGQVPSLMTFLGKIGSGIYLTFGLDNISIAPNGPAVCEADLIVYSSDLSAGQIPAPAAPTTPEPTTTPKDAESETESEILRLETLMRRATLEKDWAAAVAHGRHILELEPGRANVIDMLYDVRIRWGRELLDQGLPNEARAQYQEALQLVPDGVEALDGLAALEPAAPTSDLPGDAQPTETPVITPPTAEPSTDTSDVQPLKHTVRGGESLWIIALRYKVTVQDLIDANDLSNTIIYVGQTLIIPAKGSLN